MNATAIQASYEDARPFAPVPLNGNDSPPVWGVPDMAIVRANRMPPAPFPGETMGTLWPLMKDLAEGAGAPVDYVATSILAVAASLIGGKRWVKPWDGWVEPCIFWNAIVGSPSSAKSPALDAAILPLRQMDVDIAERHKAALMSYAAVAERASAESKLWQEKVKQAAKDGVATPCKPDGAEAPDAPQRKRLYVQDSTPEEMAAILSGNPSGTLHLRDELAGWIESFERYTAGGRPFWLEAYGGRQFVVDRKGLPKPIVVPFNGVSVLGGIQPDKLRDALLNSSDDGLAARFMWVWPDPIEYRRPKSVADRAKLDEIYRRLERLSWISEDARDLPFSTQAAAIFEEWIKTNTKDTDETVGLYAALLGKMRGRAARLALILEMLTWAADGGPEPSRVSEQSLARSLLLVDDYFKPHARRTFGDAALPQVDKDARAVARMIVKDGSQRINAREVYTDPRIHFGDAASMDAAAELLIDINWLRAAPSRAGSTPGRAKKDYLVNPAVHGGAHV
ncbi:DUF3987 domain-containing protein [Sphingomonas faeni]|uniref:DUF3987 domain-containing protein n=1 Tax=Sphingomonas faeni TaxID=185950 RepID=UPI00335CAE4F